MKNWTSLSLNEWWVVSVPSLYYSPVQRRRKKKATHVRSPMAMFLGVVLWAVVSKAWIMLTGRGCTLSGGESYF